MNPKPEISVLIPNYNRGTFLRDTLWSVLEQSFTNWEAIVVDDGSTDDSLDVCREFAERDERIRYFVRDRQPRGAPTCRNIAWEKSVGEYVLFLDSDDLLAPFCLEQRVQAFHQYPEMDFLVFPMLIFSKDTSDADVLWNKPGAETDLERFLRLDSTWQTSGPAWKRESVAKINGFTENLACWQDVDFHLKALTQSLNYLHVPHAKPDIFYRRHTSGSISQGEINSPAKMQTRLEIFIHHTDNLKERMTPALQKASRELGASVVFGAAKSLNKKVMKQALAHGRQAGLFNASFQLKAQAINLCYRLRINRLSFINRKLNQVIASYRTPSSIGTFNYES